MEKTPDPPERPQPKDTPHSRGAGSHTAYDTRNDPKQYRTYLQEDINTYAELPIADFLEVVLKLRRVDWEERTPRYKEYKRITESNDFKQRLKIYAQPVNNERDRYHPFVTLMESILKQLHHEDLKPCRNDHAMVLGSYAYRSPNIGIFDNIVFSRGTRDSPDKFSKSGPTGPELGSLGFHWVEFLSFFEHKLERHDLKNPSPMKEKLGSIIIHTQSKGDDPFTETSRDMSQEAVDAQVPDVGSSSKKVIERDTNQENRRMTRSMTRGEHDSGGRKRKSEDAQLEVKGSQGTKKARSNEIRGSGSKALNQGPTKPREGYMVQCAGYALEMLSHGGLRSHVIGSLVTDDKLELLYYDRSIHARSEPINIQTEPIILVAIIDAMGKLRDADWGYDDFLERPTYLTNEKDLPTRREDTEDETSYKIFEKSELKLGNGYVLELEEEVFHQHALIGRGTCVVKANVKGSGLVGQGARRGTVDSSKWTRPLIVKFSYGAEMREESESQIVQKLREMVEGEGGEMLNHLPDILWSEERELHGIPVRVADCLNQVQSGVYERRKLYVTVQEELYRVKDLARDRKVKEFGEAIRHISKCYQWVYEKGYLHRDIGVGNMMYRLRDKKLFGVLNDYDLAIVTSRKGGSTSKQQTGTLPYIAYELLLKNLPNHMYRHDLESVFYCILDMTLANVKVKRNEHTKVEPALWKWREASMGNLGDLKAAFFFQVEYKPRFRRGFEGYLGAVSALRIMFRDGYVTFGSFKSGLLGTSFDIYTCNQAITFEKFHKLLSSI